MRPMSSRSARSPTHREAGGVRIEPSTSFGIVDGARFPDDGHFDLAGVFELVLDAARDVLGEPDGFLVRHLFALDHDADLAAGLEGERLRDALEGVGDPLQLLEAL